MKSLLFTPLKIRDIEIRNRLFVSPMCQYSAIDGVPQTWHMVHLGSRAVGGAGLVMVEATAVSADGRISPGDVGLWNEVQLQAFKPIVKFIKEQGATPAMQLAHAGRKASSQVPWVDQGRPLKKEEGAWTTVAPSALAFTDGHPTPKALTAVELKQIIEDFKAAAKRALDAGIEVIELHAAHGYLMHEFLSPISNHRTDEFGGSLENRMRFPLQVAKALRDFWPQNLPVFVRISATDWTTGGWDVEQSVVFVRELKKIGVDLIDCSSGGNVSNAQIPVAPGYQTPFADQIRRETGMMTGAVGMIVQPEHAEEILANGRADAVFMARELLRDPYWVLHAATPLRADIAWPKQYGRAK